MEFKLILKITVSCLLITLLAGFILTLGNLFILTNVFEVPINSVKLHYSTQMILPILSYTFSYIVEFLSGYFVAEKAKKNKLIHSLILGLLLLLFGIIVKIGVQVHTPSTIELIYEATTMLFGLCCAIAGGWMYLRDVKRKKA
jgi:hypothetical protein